MRLMGHSGGITEMLQGCTFLAYFALKALGAFSPEGLVSAGSLDFEDVDVVAGGAPCRTQPWSQETISEVS